MPILYYSDPGGGTYFAMVQLTDDGDHINYNHTAGTFLSNFVGDSGVDYSPTVRVDGVLSGGVVIPAVSGTDDLVDVSSLAANIAGVALTGAAKAAADTDLSCTRGGVGTEYLINSIVCDSAGTFTVVAGTGAAADNSTGARDAAGAPPLIPLLKIEVAQVRFTTSADAAVTAAEIKMTPNVTREMSRNGKTIYARTEGGALGSPGVQMTSAQSLIHTGAVSKGIWMSGYSESFTEWQGANNVQLQGETVSSTSSETFTETRSFPASEVSDGSFDWDYTDLANDPEWATMDGKGALVWFKLYQKSSDTSYLAGQSIVSGVPAVAASGPTTTSLTLSGGTKYLRITG